MRDEKTTSFWIGNAILALALLVLLFMGTLWERFGIGAMVLWVLLFGAGAYLMMKDKGGPGPFPD